MSQKYFVFYQIIILPFDLDLLVFYLFGNNAHV
jgi:hypothetical protein